MVNFGLNSASILGIFLAVAGASLYFLRSVRPELSRDHDIFFAAVGLLCGLILLFQGWRLDPILQFGQFLLTGSTIFFAVETIRLRGAATEQARRNTPIVDEERPVSRVYRAELDQLEPYDVEEQYDKNRRLRGQQDPRTSGRSGYESEEPRSPRSRSASDQYSSRESNRKRPPRPSTAPRRAQHDDWGETPDHWEERPSSSRPSRRRSESRPAQTPSRQTKKRRNRPSDRGVASTRNSEATPADYVDYRPIDNPDYDNPDWDRDQNQDPNQDRNRDLNRNGDNAVRFDY
ncbi:MAG: Ycf66 family protein [Xenococcaceae cyanobacterium]